MRITIAVLVAAVVLGACGGSEPAPTTPVAAPGDAVVVTLDSATFAFPAVACDPASDPEAVGATAVERARRVEELAGRRASGWPTTTVAPPDEVDTWEDDIARAGVEAVVMARLAGTQPAVADEWAAYEASYADEAGAWGGIDHISTRLDAWQSVASDVEAALPAACAAAGFSP